MRIFLLEDDWSQSEWIENTLRARFPNATIIVKRTEQEFRNYLSKLDEPCPDVFLLDVMVPWTKSSEDMPTPPDDVRDDGSFRSGIRCLELLNAETRMAKSHKILYTILERSDLQSEVSRLEEKGINVLHVRKDDDATELFDRVSGA